MKHKKPKKLLLQKSVFNLPPIQLNIFLVSHYSKRTEVLTYPHLSNIRTEFPPRKMWSLGTAVLPREVRAWPELDRGEYCINLCIIYSQTQPPVIQSITYFLDLQLENTCFSFCQWSAEKQEINQAEITNLEKKYHWFFLILHKIHSFLKWQNFNRQIDLKIIVLTDSRVTMDCSEKENRFGSSFSLYYVISQVSFWCIMIHIQVHWLMEHQPR